MGPWRFLVPRFLAAYAGQKHPSRDQGAPKALRPRRLKRPRTMQAQISVEEFLNALAVATREVVIAFVLVVGGACVLYFLA
jgi:hypothetical protein